MNLETALHAEEGICCFVGAGGKKSTMYRLAERLERAVVTATVRIPPFPEHVAAVEVTDDPVTAIDTTSSFPLGVVRAQEGPDRFLGYDPSMVNEFLETRAKTVLVKADGARMRRFKAPGSNEPQLPSAASTIVPIASVHVIGKPLDEDRVHRVDRVAEITGLDVGDSITPEAMAEVLASNRGGHKEIPTGATVIPLLNMVDNVQLRDTAERVAAELHKRVSVPHVVLGSMTASDPVVSVVAP